MTGPRSLPPGATAGWSLLLTITAVFALYAVGIGVAAYRIYKEITSGR